MKIAASLTVVASLPIAGVVSSNQVKAASYNQTEMRSFVRSTLANYYARGTTVIIKDGHPQQISYGYGYYGKRLVLGIEKSFILFVHCKR